MGTCAGPLTTQTTLDVSKGRIIRSTTSNHLLDSGPLQLQPTRQRHTQGQYCFRSVHSPRDRRHRLTICTACTPRCTQSCARWAVRSPARKSRRNYSRTAPASRRAYQNHHQHHEQQNPYVHEEQQQQQQRRPQDLPLAPLPPALSTCPREQQSSDSEDGGLKDAPKRPKAVRAALTKDPSYLRSLHSPPRRPPNRPADDPAWSDDSDLSAPSSDSEGFGMSLPRRASVCVDSRLRGADIYVIRLAASSNESNRRRPSAALAQPKPVPLHHSPLPVPAPIPDGGLVFCPKYADSRPCWRCLEWMAWSGIRRAYWSMPGGTWEGGKVSELVGCDEGLVAPKKHKHKKRQP